ncbi:porin family protein [Marinobacter sp. SS13-12]|uniref:porin family protein n=1 Tax=Marinobacter sp. SS13-12 TaxID=3050451 RepID=UPI002555807B|nr:porin family protein [Marinobacter sp. SS13-12]MDK8463407.1 porin family protein [Marinobacter sp. SS13-12]
MKNKIVLGSAFAVLASFASGASAQDAVEGGYVGLNYAFVTYEEDGLSEDFDLGALVGKAGVRINPYLAAEFRAGFGAKDDSTSFNGASLDLEIDYLVGGYMVLGLPNESPVYPYAIVGATKGELTASATGPGGSASASASESDLSFGVGANLNINQDFQVNGEYMQYIDKDGAEISGVSIGFAVLF